MNVVLRALIRPGKFQFSKPYALTLELTITNLGDDRSTDGWVSLARVSGKSACLIIGQLSSGWVVVGFKEKRKVVVAP